MLHKLHTNLFSVYFPANLSSRKWKTFWWVFLPSFYYNQRWTKSRVICVWFYPPSKEKLWRKKPQSTRKQVKTAFLSAALWPTDRGRTLGHLNRRPWITMNTNPFIYLFIHLWSSSQPWRHGCFSHFISELWLIHLESADYLLSNQCPCTCVRSRTWLS